MAGQFAADRAYDEAIPVETDDEEDDVSTPASSEAGSPTSKPSPQGARGNQGGGIRAAPQKSPQTVDSGKPARGRGDDDAESNSGESSSSSEGSSSDSSEGGEGGEEKKSKPAAGAGGYNPADFDSMDVSAEIQELFQYITRYKPHTIELDSHLKPFIPELIPSIGEVDAFLKMPLPSGEISELGTTRLDEPTMNPSDPSILDLQLRALSKAQDLQPMEVRSIENAEKNSKEVENWVKRIDDLNRSKPAPTVQYSRRMPDIETLMQVWPAEFEEYLQENSLPDLSDLDLDLASIVKIFASVLDVPVYGQITETLHVIFTLYSEFQSNQHFAKAEQGDGDPYSFAQMPNFAQGPGGAVSAGGTGNVFGGPSSESIAPSRAPSPEMQGQR
mmetsp:Transcript_134990/g.288816  ORF Transcript_134990/g.288816 Transcript_134990/m.288816 type:complete len:388 (-) Transcript_134990:158-1321(-)